jgi:FixJ family two-component response regulator
MVFVVDDDSAVRTSLKRLIQSLGLDAQTFASAHEFLGESRPDRPACLVLDVRLPDLSGLDLQQELVRLHVDLPIIFITGHGDIPMSVRAMKAGAVEFLTKPFREQELVEAIQHGIERHRAARQRNAELAGLRLLYDSLTAREREVFPLVASGMLNKQVADQLGTREKTVKVHRGQLMRKMKADSLADLIRMAGRLRLPSPKS